MPGEAKGTGMGEDSPREKLIADLFSARSRSSTGLALKGLPISTVIFCGETSRQWIDRSRGRGAHNPSAKMLSTPLGPPSLFKMGWSGSVTSKGPASPGVHAQVVPILPLPWLWCQETTHRLCFTLFPLLQAQPLLNLGSVVLCGSHRAEGRQTDRQTDMIGGPTYLPKAGEVGWAVRKDVVHSYGTADREPGCRCRGWSRAVWAPCLDHPEETHPTRPLYKAPLPGLQRWPKR